MNSSTPDSSVPGLIRESESCRTDLSENPTPMKPDYLQNGCTRAEAILDGQLHDLTQIKAAINCRFLRPTAMTRALWHALAGDAPFALDHPHLLQLCRLVVSAIATGRAERWQQGLFSETAMLHVPLRGRALHLKMVCHPGDAGEPVLTLLEGSEVTQFEI
jgi:hypothetical protein